jgi:pimeloyl-ACP methyl ester carboxylesterase
MLDGFDVVAPDRPSSGRLDDELAFLAPLAHGTVVVGVSGGATLGLALAASDVPLAGAVLHEPAVGSLVPGLLDHVVAGWTTGGVEGLGKALYGSSWSGAMAPDDPAAVARDLAMFRAFEPLPPRPGQGPVVATVGADAPPLRHAAARALEDRLGLSVRVLPGGSHFVHHDRPEALADVVRELCDAVGRGNADEGAVERGIF